VVRHHAVALSLMSVHSPQPRRRTWWCNSEWVCWALRLCCNLIKHRKPQGATYYPALLLPLHFEVDGCSHPNVNPADVKVLGSDAYNTAIDLVERHRTQTEYETACEETGIPKALIFSGLPEGHTLGMPGMNTLNLMHICCLDLSQLLDKLWRGQIPCDPSVTTVTLRAVDPSHRGAEVLDGAIVLVDLDASSGANAKRLWASAKTDARLMALRTGVLGVAVLAAMPTALEPNLCRLLDAS
jgi:hypothetical protein